MELNCELLKKDFKFDGMLLDIYVQDRTLEDSKKLFEYLKTSPYGIEISDSEKNADWKDFNIEKYYSSNPDERILKTLSLTEDGVTICWFLGVDPVDLEFNIDPREILDMKKVDVVLRFMKRLAALFEKEAILTPENLPEKPILVCEPKTGDIRYIPA
jgi:hypothetical protein